MRRSKILYSSIILIFLLTGIAGSVLAQLPETSRTNFEKLPNFIYDNFFSVGTPGKTKVDFIYQIKHDALQFLMKDSIYCASYEFAIQIKSDKKEVMDTKIFSRHISVKHYDETLSRKDFDSAEQNFMLPPGNYNISIALTDDGTKKTARRNFKLKVPGLERNEIDVSSIIFGFTSESDGDKEAVWYPVVDNVVPEDHRQITMRFTVYNRSNLNRMPVRYELKSLKKSNKDKRENELSVEIADSINYVELPIDLYDLSPGSYEIKIELADGKFKIKRKSTIVLHLDGLPVYAADLDDAINSLVHIADGKELKKIKKAKGDEKSTLFFQFWEANDPSPGTPANELMDEYYRRVAYTMRQFGRYNPGWRTDRGRIYILLGPPDDVNRRHFEPNVDPYEVWFYSQYNRTFLFVDENGYGEYRLKTPNWDIFH
ncbi:GWxTD domain-containing protein [bacterium]|nr:GWxTD domain-containing protein [bacterium]